MKRISTVQILLLLSVSVLLPLATGRPGASVPWRSFEAEAMETTGVVRGPVYEPHSIALESSKQAYVELEEAGEYLRFMADGAANSVVLRFNLPDGPLGGGLSSRLAFWVDGTEVRTLELSSCNAWLYGNYPFSNNPAFRKPRNFYDEIRVKDLNIGEGSELRLQKVEDDGVVCRIDLIDLEWVQPPLEQPEGALSVMDYGAVGDGLADDTAALRNCLAAATAESKTVWVPAGRYKLTGDISLASQARIQGAGMWHTEFVGDPELYGQADRRVRFRLVGSSIQLADFAIVGALNYRNDSEANDGILGEVCAAVEISRVWVEHTKVGVWINNGSDVSIEDCRFRNLIADGTNFCVGTSDSLVDNCTARGTGDDCFAIWPAVFDTRFLSAERIPGNNTIRNSTGRLTFLANGAAVYGGKGNRIEGCLFEDIGTGSGILISTTFPTARPELGIDHSFAGTTSVKDVSLVRCGGYDHAWQWRGALQLCMDRRGIDGLALSNVEIEDSLSHGLDVVGPGDGVLTNARVTRLQVSGHDLAAVGKSPLYVRGDAEGRLSLLESMLDEVVIDSDDFVVERDLRLKANLAAGRSALSLVATPEQRGEFVMGVSDNLRVWETLPAERFVFREGSHWLELNLEELLSSEAPRVFFRGREYLSKN